MIILFVSNNHCHTTKQFPTTNFDRLSTMTSNHICDLSPSSSTESAFLHRPRLRNDEVDLRPPSTGSLAVTSNTTLLAVFWNATFQPVHRDELRQILNEESVATGPAAADILGEALLLADVMTHRKIKTDKRTQSSTACLPLQ